ncbi:MAG: helix-turn-helix domain-containing protein [Clostridiales bacterium]|nr:helix-turn-helix domain-containing protein [Clostridiales bacterium]
MKKLSHYLNIQRAQHPQIVNWRENSINDFLFYSYRSTDYDRETYPARLHYHDYYELVIVLSGKIRYLCGSHSYQPQKGDIILIPPRTLHMSMIDEETTRYTRHVFYLYPNAFDAHDCAALADFLRNQPPHQYLITLPPEAQQELFSLLPRLDQALAQEDSPLDRALALGYILQIFYLLNKKSRADAPADSLLPPNVVEIQRYLDTHFAEITSVAQVAEHFYYSREYLSRLFKQYFHTSVGDYLLKRRVACSQSLIAQGTPLLDACFLSGFTNASTFIRSFRTITGMTPSQYRAMLQEKRKD